MNSEQLTVYNDAIILLDGLISLPSISGNEGDTATMLEQALFGYGIDAERHKNNVWAISEYYDPAKPTLMLNSHHDTVRPASTYTLNPYKPIHTNGRIYGLGSTDAGASVVSLVEVFKQLYKQHLNVNLLLALTAEEEISGANGIESLLRHLGEKGIKPDMAIVGEPTGMQASTAERGLVVLDCTSTGTSGHAAREEGDNAIYHALDDIDKLRKFKFERTSPSMGDVKISITMINAGKQHNMIPDRCDFVADIRTNDVYTNEEVVGMLSSAIHSDARARSTRLRASSISADHPLTKAATRLGLKTFVSPTLSDRALMHGIAALKIGPGESSRSHTADEYVEEQEITAAIDIYQKIITTL